MSRTIRPFVPEEFEAASRVLGIAFGDIEDELAELRAMAPHLEYERTLAAFDDGRPVGVSANLSLELTLPGGGRVPAGGVTLVGVLPTHRRQGILRSLMEGLLRDSRARGEPVSILMSAQGPLYRRFGYGAGTWRTAVEMDAGPVGYLAPPKVTGRVRILDDGEAAQILPALWDQLARERAGAVDRGPAWWAGKFGWLQTQKGRLTLHAVHEDEGGRPDGYVAYQLKPDWDGAVARGTLTMTELVASDPEVRAELWRYCLETDLVSRVECDLVPVDEPLRWRLADPRRLRVTAVADDLWVRPLDVPRLLTARSYRAEGSLVLGVTDRPAPEITGTYRLEATPEGADCTRGDFKAELTLDNADLGALLLGGTTFASLAAAGLVEEHAPGAVRRADDLFRTEQAPFNGTWF